ncbi:MAG: hypothetical protein ACTSRA_16040 [Promethearchaeota archaeon]
MIFQNSAETNDILLAVVFFIIALLILFLFNFLSVRLIESKELASRKKGMEFLSALIGIILFFVLNIVWNLFASLFDMLIFWEHQNYIPSLGPILAFLVYTILIHWLIDVSWKNSILIGLLATLLLLIFLTFVPYLGSYLGQYYFY